MIPDPGTIEMTALRLEMGIMAFWTAYSPQTAMPMRIRTLFLMNTLARILVWQAAAKKIAELREPGDEKTKR